MSYNRRRTILVSYAEFKQLSFGYDPQAAALMVWHVCAPVFPERVPFFAGCRVCFANPAIKKTAGHEPAVMRPVSGCAGMSNKEISCQKNWLSARLPMSGESRFWKKVS